MHNAGKPRVTLTPLYKHFCSCFCCLASSTGSIPYCNPGECDAPSSCKCLKGGKASGKCAISRQPCAGTDFPLLPIFFPRSTENLLLYHEFSAPLGSLVSLIHKRKGQKPPAASGQCHFSTSLYGFPSHEHCQGKNQAKKQNIGRFQVFQSRHPWLWKPQPASRRGHSARMLFSLFRSELVHLFKSRRRSPQAVPILLGLLQHPHARG